MESWPHKKGSPWVWPLPSSSNPNDCICRSSNLISTPSVQYIGYSYLNIVSKAAPMLSNIFSIKYGALALLVLQNTFLVIMMRVSRTSSGPMYASSTAVAVMEGLKFITCLLVVATTSPVGLWQSIKAEIINQPMELVKLSVPSLLYTVQNNLLYYALSHLDAATYLVGYQLKILTTAVFTVIMLGKSLSALQWFSLILLTIGVSMAQYTAKHNAQEHHNTTAGFIAVIAAACTSGFSGVYFEKILKGSTTSLWMRNIQMGGSSIILGLMGVYAQDYKSVSTNGFFYGYTPTVWVVVLLQAIGGLVVAVVVKYADNILKGFAAAFSIITACIICYLFLDFKPTLLFLFGAVLVNLSIYIYDRGLPQFLMFLRTESKTDGASNSIQAISSSLLPILAKNDDEKV